LRAAIKVPSGGRTLLSGGKGSARGSLPLLNENLIEKEFQFKKIDAMKFTTPHDVYQ